MVQREVAERIAAPPGKMSYLSVFVQYHARVRIAFRVPAAAFEPEPAVESAVIVVEPYAADDRLDAATEDELWRLVQAAFRERRKMLHNVLVAPAPARRRHGVTAALATAGHRPRPAAADPRGRGVAGPARGARPDRRTGAAAGAVTGPTRRMRPTDPAALPGRPARPGQAQPDPGRRRAPARRLPRAPLGHGAARPRRPAQLAPAAGRRATRSTSTGFDPGPPADNLVLRALAAARDAVGGGWPGGPGPAPALAARLEKRIPVAAGLAGGSSDAAATVDGALEAWGAELDDEARLAVAAHLGSDVPFFLAGGPALVEGRGERVAPLHGLLGTPGVVLVTPDVAVPTPDVFAAFDAIRTHGDGAVRMSSAHLAEELAQRSDRADLVARAPASSPWPTTCCPPRRSSSRRSSRSKRALSRLLNRPIGLSGSGPTLWALYASEAEASGGRGPSSAAPCRRTLPRPGGGDPFVAATAISDRPDQPEEQP